MPRRNHLTIGSVIAKPSVMPMAAKSGVFCSRHVLVLQVKHGTEGTDPDMVKQHQPPPTSVNPARGPATVLEPSVNSLITCLPAKNDPRVIGGTGSSGIGAPCANLGKQETEYVRLPIEAEG
ncbi:hypothetical protein NliqN6_6256 [Naganishia liquefaciens]|uniref:Uncharacterized protein n=1 Tax=Naganishia liquefaciens TaxID=104408 RepID=A0A8H3U127_9TREE|nr:hypothetical protein NliqN6_6256 [Naganishia liquefaciens]